MVLLKFGKYIGKKAKEAYEEGKSQYNQRLAANKIIKERARAAGLREREKQRIRFAQERERIAVNEAIRKEKERYKPRKPTSFISGNNNGLLDVMGYGRQPQTTKQLKPIKVRKKVRKGKKKTKGKTRIVYVRQAPNPQPQRFDVMGRSKDRYNII